VHEVESINFTGIMINIAVKLCTWDFAFGVIALSVNLQFSGIAQKVFDL
jgi:hypothetical protein